MASSEHQYINRIFSLLDCFSVENPELGVREAARMLNISPSSCGRLLSELRDEGILVQDMESRSYSLGGRVIRWAEVYSESSDLRKKAFPFMEEIYKKTNETVTLYTAEEFDRVCVERIESRKTVRVSEPIGTRINIFTGSGGKSILAFRTKEEIDHVLNMPGHFQNTKTLMIFLSSFKMNFKKFGDRVLRSVMENGNQTLQVSAHLYLMAKEFRLDQFQFQLLHSVF